MQPLSVCMATYNGAKYVEAQLHSILRQLDDADQVVIVDDASTDETVRLIDAVHDRRVQLIRLSTNVGYVAAFEMAISNAAHDVVLLSDQDDEWVDGRVAAMRSALRTHAVVAGNLTTLGGPDRIRGPYGQRDWRLHARDADRPGRNRLAILAGNRPYYGSAMGLNRTAIDVALPFPNIPESHDLWIALCGTQLGSLKHLEQPVTARRFHDANQTPPRPRALPVVIRSRLRLLRLIGEARRRVDARKSR